MCKERGKVNAPANLCRVRGGGAAAGGVRGGTSAREMGRGCARGDAAGGWTGRRALRGYWGRTETPPAKLSACATCRAANRGGEPPRAIGRGGASREGGGHGRWRPSIAP